MIYFNLKTMKYKNGDSFNGNWQSDKMNGKGVKTIFQNLLIKILLLFFYNY